MGRHGRKFELHRCCCTEADTKEAFPWLPPAVGEVFPILLLLRCGVFKWTREGGKKEFLQEADWLCYRLITSSVGDTTSGVGGFFLCPSKSISTFSHTQDVIIIITWNCSAMRWRWWWSLSLSSSSTEEVAQWRVDETNGWRGIEIMEDCKNSIKWALRRRREIFASR